VILTANTKNAFRIEMDSDAFLYVVQQSYDSLAVADNIYGLSKWDLSGASPVEMWHVNLDAAPPHDSPQNALNAQATSFAGLALDEPRGRVYVSRRNTDGRPVHNVIGYSMETGELLPGMSFATALSIVGTDTTLLSGGGGNNIRDIAVDAAGNVLSVNSSSEALRVHSPPDGPNNFNTYSPWAIDVGNSTVIATPIDFATSVDDKISTIPLHYSIAQNYPNPFNAGTVIQYSLPIDSDVNLIIYDLLGREVVSLVQTRQNAGTHSVQWLGTNNQDLPVASGIYFYKITARSSSRVNQPFSVTKRLLYLK